MEPYIEYSRLIEGIIIGGAGGAVAGITLKLIGWIADFYRFDRDSNQVYDWLCENTSDASDKKKPQFRSTRTIASHNNLTEDRVRYICSRDNRIKLSTGPREDMWEILDRKKEKIINKNQTG